MNNKKNETRTFAVNKKAYHEFNILQKVEAGIVLLGTEVKSTIAGNINLSDGFCLVRNGEIFLKNVHISPYSFGNRVNHDPLRERKLLLHKREITKLGSKVKEKGLTIIPLRVYRRNHKIKLELGLGKGKKLYSKKEDIKKKDTARDLKRRFKTSDLSGKLK